MKKYGYGIMVLVLVFSLVLAACAAPKAPAPAPAPASRQPTPSAPQLTPQQQLEEAAKKEGELDIWVEEWSGAQEMEKIWSAKYPSITLKVWDSSAMNIVPKAIEEAKVDRYSVDVFNIADSWAFDLVKADLIREYDFPNVKGWQLQPEHNFYRNLYGGANSPLYNTELITAAESPKTYAELKDPKWSGKAILSTSPVSTPLALAYLWRKGDVLNWEESEKYWNEMFQVVRPMTSRGFSSTLERVIAGEFHLFLLCSNAAGTRAIKLGAPVAFSAFKDPLYTMPVALAIAKNAPHPNAAQLFVDFVTEKDITMLLAEGRGEISYHPEATLRVTGNRLTQGLNMFVIPPEYSTNPEYSERTRAIWSEITGMK
ncbi:ABC transporter substrate-binding protein [Chloroflexota bacterium]